MDFPDSSHFSAVIADPRFIVALAITVLSGVVRGFSGFGSALIYIPRVAAASFLLIDFFCTAPFAARLYPISNKKEIWPLTFAAALTIPLGAMLLRIVDPVPLRWAIAIMILALLVVLISGWRLRGAASLPHTRRRARVGCFRRRDATRGPIRHRLLARHSERLGRGSRQPDRVLRAHRRDSCRHLHFPGIVSARCDRAGTAHRRALHRTLNAGTFFFKGSSESLYRRIAYAIVAGAALISLPTFDGIFQSR